MTFNLSSSPRKRGSRSRTLFRGLFTAWIPAFVPFHNDHWPVRTSINWKKLSWYAGMMFLFFPALFAAPPKVTIPALEFKPGQADRTKLRNGAVVYVLEDHELPLFNLNVRIKVSPADEIVPESFDFLGAVWRTGGTKLRSPEKLNEELEQKAISVETSADKETVSITLSCLSRDIPEGLEVFTDILLNPAFNADQLSLAKAKVLEGLRRKNETPTLIARRAFRDVVFGRDHVYAEEPTEKTVEGVSRGALVALHKKVVTPDQAVIAVSGDFNKAEIISELETHLSGWAPTGRAVPAYDFSVRSAAPGKVFLVQKQANQTRITMGRVSAGRHNPDHFPLLLADYILGGGGPSRLFGEIRSRLGLAYVVGSFVIEPAGPGLVGVACETKAPSTIAAITAIEKELDKFTAGPIDNTEVKLAKEATVNSYVFGFDSPWDVANARASNEFYGYAPDYPDTATARIRAVSKDDIARVARRYYATENMKIMIVGDEKKFDQPAESLGNVTRIPLSDIP